MPDPTGSGPATAGPVRPLDYVQLPDGREGWVTLIEVWRGQRGAEVAVPGQAGRAWCPVSDLTVIGRDVA